MFLFILFFHKVLTVKSSQSINVLAKPQENCLLQIKNNGIHRIFIEQTELVIIYRVIVPCILYI